MPSIRNRTVRSAGHVISLVHGDLYHGGGDDPIFMYTSQMLDAGLNFYYFPFRFYPASLGR